MSTLVNIFDHVNMFLILSVIVWFLLRILFLKQRNNITTLSKSPNDCDKSIKTEEKPQNPMVTFPASNHVNQYSHKSDNKNNCNGEKNNPRPSILLEQFFYLPPKDKRNNGNKSQSHNSDNREKIIPFHFKDIIGRSNK
jgi:hypothetical protein